MNQFEEINQDCKEVDIYLIHVPAKFKSNYLIMQMAVGVVSICEHLLSAGIEARILHLGIERLRRPRIRLLDLFEDSKPKIVGFSLHWYWQLKDTLEEASILKKQMPEIFIVLGGITASFFAIDIMKNHPYIDAIIKGEGEVPLTQLANKLISGNFNFENVPNLVCRKNGTIFENKISFFANSDELNGYTFGVSSSMNFQDIYFRTNISDNILNPQFMFDATIVLSLSRGCRHKCSFCSASNLFYSNFMGRKSPSYLNWQSLLNIVLRARSFGVNHFYISADVELFEECFIKALESLSRQQIRPRFDIECWTLPSIELLNAVKKYCTNNSNIILSPTCGSERVRYSNRSCFVNNEAYEQLIDKMAYLNIPTWLYFTIGLPFETHGDVKATFEWQKKLSLKYLCFCHIETQPVSIEPGSPMYSMPEKYGISIKRKSLDDFLYMAPDDGVGYDTKFFTSEDIINFLKKK
jgi:radical SAM superfamily enzyme YgiQ (UPF0313 family)